MRQEKILLSIARKARSAALAALLSTIHFGGGIAAAQFIDTIVGPGATGDGGAAAAAQLKLPESVAADAAGNIYIADSRNHRIRKVDAATGVISTIAGTGAAGFSGDGGPAAAARLQFPRGVAVDGAGNVYIGDMGNHRVRKVDAATGNISTIAGAGVLGVIRGRRASAATAAQLHAPIGVAADAAGNLYIADSNNHRILKVDADGAVAVIAGTGTQGFSGDGGPAAAAQLSRPYGVAADAAGNLYIADRSSHIIRKVDATAGSIATIAGARTGGGFSGDGGAASAAQFSSPTSLAVDDAGNLYIADSYNHRVRKVDAASGNISTIAGTGTQGFSGDGGPAAAAQLSFPYGTAVDGAGNLYIADKENQRIRKVDAAGNISTFAGSGTTGDGGAASAAQLRQARSVAADAAGNLYIAGHHRIRRVDAASGNISTIAGTGEAGFGGDGGPAAAAQLNFPHHLSADGAGNVYIADRNNHRIRKVDAASGNISTIAGTGEYGFGGDGGPPAAAAQLRAPSDAVPDAAGNLYIADRVNQRIRKVDAASGNISTIAGTGEAGFGGDGGPATAAQLNFPNSAALDGAGNVYIADRENHRIRRVDAASGEISTVAGTGEAGFSGDGGPAAAAQLRVPRDAAVDAAGNLYIADTDNRRIRKVDAATGNISTIAGSGNPVDGIGDGCAATAAQLSRPYGVAVDGAGNVYIADSLSDRIRKVSPQPPSSEAACADDAPAAQPALLETGGLVNAARMSAYGERGLFGPRLLPLAPGSAVVVQGENFIADRYIEAESSPLPTILGGVRVRIDGREVPLFAVGPQRIEAQLPWALGGETLRSDGLALAEIVVESGGLRSRPRLFWAARYAPGVFTVSGSGQGRALALFAGTTTLAAPLDADRDSRPARAGDVLEIYAAGLGAVQPQQTDGRNSCETKDDCLANGANAVLRHTVARPRVWIGDYELAAENIRFSGLAPSMVGVNLVVVEVPRNVPPSAAAELRLAVGGLRSQSGVTIAVE